MIKETQAYVLPLTREQFWAALQKGQGRAVRQAQRHGLTGLTDLVVQACIRTQALDAQCEADRAPWLLEIIDAAAVEGALVGPILDGFRHIGGDNSFWDTVQLCHLAKAFAERGHADARAALYGQVRKSDTSMDVLAAEEIIALDGADGLLHVAEVMGSWVEGKAEIVLDDNPILWYDERHGEGTAVRLLEAAALNNPRIRAFLERHWRPDPTAARRSPADRYAAMTPDEVVRQITTSNPDEDRYWYLQWGRHASDDAVEYVAERMFEEPHPGRLIKYLRVLQGHPTGQFDPRLLKFMDLAYGDLPWLLMMVLAKYQHPEVRAVAVKLLKEGKSKNGVLKLLARNYQQGDHRFIQEVVTPPSDRIELHALAWDILDVYKVNKVPEGQHLLVFAYENTPCSNCRGKAVDLLLDMHQVPEWLIEECKHDVDFGTRETVGAQK